MMRKISDPNSVNGLFHEYFNKSRKCSRTITTGKRQHTGTINSEIHSC